MDITANSYIMMVIKMYSDVHCLPQISLHIIKSILRGCFTVQDILLYGKDIEMYKVHNMLTLCLCTQSYICVALIFNVYGAFNLYSVKPCNKSVIIPKQCSPAK